MNADSTPRRTRGKADESPTPAGTPARKPRRKKKKDFPLGIHKGTGYWSKKVRGRVYYFGKVADDPKGEAALDEWLRVKDDLLAGKEPQEKTTDGLTVETLCFKFLEYHEARRDGGELRPRTYQCLFATAKMTAKTLGRAREVAHLHPDDFRKLKAKIQETRGLIATRNEMSRVRSIFRFAFDEGLIDAPVRYGKGFDVPKKETIDRERERKRDEHGAMMFESDELRAILAEAKQPMKAMILLAANCAFGNSDLSALPVRAVDLDEGWVNFARVKTSVRRRCPLWPETVEALREWLPMRARRKKARDPADEGLLFRTRTGQRYVRTNAKGSPSDQLGNEFKKLLDTLELKRPGRSLYAVRHTFETIGGETLDQDAVDVIMGHKIKGMRAHYIERIGDDRLRAVVEHVRSWLFPPEESDGDATDVEEKLNSESCDPSDPATREVAVNNGSGSQGTDGSQNRGQVSSDDDGPRLRIFAG